MNIYDFTVKTQDGGDASLSSFRGKVILVVNTATGCGFTPQYAELEDMYKEFAGKGLVILDFSMQPICLPGSWRRWRDPRFLYRTLWHYIRAIS